MELDLFEIITYKSQVDKTISNQMQYSESVNLINVELPFCGLDKLTVIIVLSLY